MYLAPRLLDIVENSIKTPHPALSKFFLVFYMQSNSKRPGYFLKYSTGLFPLLTVQYTFHLEKDFGRIVICSAYNRTSFSFDFDKFEIMVMITEPQTCSIAFFANLIEIIAIRFQIGQCFWSWNPRNHKVFHTGSLCAAIAVIPPFPHLFPVGLG